MSFRFASLSFLLAMVTVACAPKKSTPRPGEPTQSNDCGPGLAIPAEQMVARIDGKTITCADLMARSKAEVQSETMEFDQRIRNIHENNLTSLISDQVLQSAADKAGLQVEKFIAANVTVEPTTLAEMQAFYDQAVAAGEELPAFEEVQDELMNFLTEQKQKQALLEFRAELRSKSEISVDLPILLPPVMQVEALGPSKGPESAKVTIVEFSDFQCGFCKKAEPIIERVLATYGDKVRLVYRDYPLPNHSLAGKAAEASHCAGLEGKYWEMHRVLFADPSKLTVPDLKISAGALGLDQSAFDECLDSAQMEDKVAASVRAGSELGVTGTPAFFVNGRLVSGAQPFERFAELIDYELSAN